MIGSDKYKHTHTIGVAITISRIAARCTPPVDVNELSKPRHAVHSQVRTSIQQLTTERSAIGVKKKIKLRSPGLLSYVAANHFPTATRATH